MKIPAFLFASFLGFASAAFGAEAPPTDVVVFPAAKVDDAFAKGLPMMVNTSYKIQAGRAESPPGGGGGVMVR